MVFLHMVMIWRQAAKDGYLVDYISVESKLKFIEQGIVYDELSEEDKEAYERTFEGEHGNLPEAISSSALNTWIFNEDTIKQVLNILMTVKRAASGLWSKTGQDDYFCQES